MEDLSALAIVAQRTIPPAGQEAIQKAILKAELERTRLDYERSRMVAEDNRVKCEKHMHMNLFNLLVNRLVEARNEIDDLKDEVADLTDEVIIAEDTALQCKITCDELRDVHIEHTVPTDTELNDRKKFMRLFNKSSPKPPLVLTSSS